MQKTYALVGLSGVGKSTLLRKLSHDLHFQHLQASEIIKEERSKILGDINSDRLRELPIADNQSLLVSGFKHRLDKDAHFVILDGHSVIDTPDGLVTLEASVFEPMTLSGMFFYRMIQRSFLSAGKMMKKESVLIALAQKFKSTSKLPCRLRLTSLQA